MKVTLRVVSNLSFTATLSKHKPLIFLEKVGGLWFLASGKGRDGNIHGNMGFVLLVLEPYSGLWRSMRSSR